MRAITRNGPPKRPKPTIEEKKHALDVASACLWPHSTDPSETTYRTIMVLQQLVAPKTIENPVKRSATRAKRRELLNVLNGVVELIEWDLAGRRWAGQERRWTGQERRDAGNKKASLPGNPPSIQHE